MPALSSRHDEGWDKIYHRYAPEDLPWELGRPRKILVELVDSGEIKPGRTLDICCGAGSNPIYLAKRGFDVTGLDISDKAISYTKERAHESGVDINPLVGSFLSLPFEDEELSFVFDFGCFHHVSVENRNLFITGVHRVLKPSGTYLLTCFSHRNGPSWNHFTREEIHLLFKDHFEIEWVRHVSSIEGDGVRRYFYEVLMKKRKHSRGRKI